MKSGLDPKDVELITWWSSLHARRGGTESRECESLSQLQQADVLNTCLLSAANRCRGAGGRLRAILPARRAHVEPRV